MMTFLFRVVHVRLTVLLESKLLVLFIVNLISEYCLLDSLVRGPSPGALWTNWVMSISLKWFLTMRSSREWNEMTAIRPPGLRNLLNMKRWVFDYRIKYYIRFFMIDCPKCNRLKGLNSGYLTIVLIDIVPYKKVSIIRCDRNLNTEVSLIHLNVIFILKGQIYFRIN